MQTNTDTTQMSHGVFQNEVISNSDSNNNQLYHGVFQNEVIPDASSNSVQPISRLQEALSYDNNNTYAKDDDKIDKIEEDNSQSRSDQFNDLQSLIMRNDITPEELQKRLDEIYYANTMGARQSSQNQTAVIKKT